MQPCYLIYVLNILESLPQCLNYFLAEKLIKRTRTVCSTRMQMLIDDGSEINWKKLILLPLINGNESLTERKRKY